MKGAKNRIGEEYGLMDFHWDIFWELKTMLGYDKKVLCKGCGEFTMYEIHSFHMALRCNKCRKTFSPTANTIFSNSKIWLQFWLKAIHILKVDNPNITLKELMKEMDCTNVTACNIRKKIRTINEFSIEYKLYEKFKEEIIKYFL